MKLKNIELEKLYEKFRKRPGLYIGSQSEAGVERLIVEFLQIRMHGSPRFPEWKSAVLKLTDEIITIELTDCMWAEKVEKEFFRKELQVRLNDDWSYYPFFLLIISTELEIIFPSGRGLSFEKRKKMRSFKNAENNKLIINFRIDRNIIPARKTFSTTLHQQITDWAATCSNVKIFLIDQRMNRDFRSLSYFSGGLAEAMEALLPYSGLIATLPVHAKRVQFPGEDFVEVALREKSSCRCRAEMISYANGARTACGGSHLDGFLQALELPSHIAPAGFDLLLSFKTNSGLNFSGCTRDEIDMPEKVEPIRKAFRNWKPLVKIRKQLLEEDG